MKNKFLIDPISITDFNADNNKLELLILFWVCAAGKNATTSARCLNDLLETWHTNESSPFEIIRKIDKITDLALELKKFGIGCFNNKARAFKQLCSSEINLKTCTVDDLEKIYSIGCKTSRCFLLHSRPNQRLSGLDTHLLKFLRDEGYDVPKSTPTGKKYKEIEKIFLNIADKRGMSPAKLDLMVWNIYKDRN
jgi:thermostable 8-oxoguanine DNA glycosylase